MTTITKNLSFKKGTSKFNPFFLPSSNVVVVTLWCAFLFLLNALQAPSLLASDISIENLLPKNESKILLNVSKEYSLNEEQTALLFVIRKIENGGPGRELGVLTKQAQRFKGDFFRSLKCQSQWAAGTIKKRYDGDLKKFADRWCPIGCENDNGTNTYWYKNATYYMRLIND